MRLFVMRGKELNSREGTMQGDPFAISTCAPSLQTLISRLQVASQAKQCWFADDATGWDKVMMARPDLEYYLNAGIAGLLQSLITKRLLRALVKKQQLTSPQKDRSIWVRLWAPGPILSSTLTVKSTNGWGK